jgi:pterin-4a-carbinolamine dehydratase
MPQFLPGHIVDRLLLQLHHWNRSGHRLEKIYPTISHQEAMAFVGRVAAAVGDAEHEPALDVQVNKRTIYLHIHTPDHRGITDHDVELAKRIDALPQPRLRPIGPGMQVE